MFARKKLCRKHTRMDLVEGPRNPKAYVILSPAGEIAFAGSERPRKSRWLRISMSRTPSWNARWNSSAVYTAATRGRSSPEIPSGGPGGGFGGGFGADLICDGVAAAIACTDDYHCIQNQSSLAQQSVGQGRDILLVSAALELAVARAQTCLATA